MTPKNNEPLPVPPLPTVGGEYIYNAQTGKHEIVPVEKGG